MIKIYVTNLGKYNEGSLVGEYLTLPASEEEIQEVLNNIGINEKYEEFFISDFETEIKGLNIGEYTNINDLNNIAETLENLDTFELKCIEAMLEDGIIDMNNLINNDLQLDNYTFLELEDNMLNEDLNLGYAVVEELYSNDISLIDNKDYYFNYESFGRDLSFDFDAITEDMDTEDKENLENMNNEELANWYIDSLGDVKELGDETIQRYFNYESFGRDVRLNGASVINNIAILN